MTDEQLYLYLWALYVECPHDPIAEKLNECLQMLDEKNTQLFKLICHGTPTLPLVEAVQKA